MPRAREVVVEVCCRFAFTALAACLVGLGGCGGGGGGGDAAPDSCVECLDGDVDGDADSSGRCGDGVVDPGEDCDDSNDSVNDECLPDCRWACGDGVVNDVELCDPGIVAGEEGACPDDCDDEDECTTDVLSGTGCQTECVHGDITSCSDGDGCCPPECDGTTDSDCAAECGNGLIEIGETCDPPETCPASCDDGDVCTADAVTGSADMCDVECQSLDIVVCANSDGCCPIGCDGSDDDDCPSVCDNGVVEPGEACDPISSCPTSCDDGDACTADVLVGEAALCTAECSAPAITACDDDDGCCPSACDATNDADCTATCDNGVVEPGEHCDPPSSCPTSCPDDGDPCTVEALVGAAATCDARCVAPTTTTCDDGDGCCPTTCDGSSDDDCSTTCGNDIVEPGETCDPPSSCPTSCPDDGDPCTAEALVGTPANCNAECVAPAVSACDDGDGCCPATCYETTDDDCTPSCGNGVVESGEWCDPPSSCPTSCADDGIACTAEVLEGSAAACTALCSHPAITTCGDGDGCCPSTCNETTDDDCTPSCGNDVVESGEWCDPPSSCPTSCADDGDPCTDDALAGAAASCTARCPYAAMTECTDGDGCCPSGCNETTDDDCTPECGNGALETGEECDDGNLVDGDGCDATCHTEAIPPTAFLVTDADLMDPHIYVSLFGCRDITNSVPLGLAPSINEQFEASITTDDDGDGYLDLSFMLVFRPLDQSVPHTGDVDVGMGLCTDPIASTECDVDPTSPMEPSTFTNDDGAVCLEPIPGTIRPYTPSIEEPTPDCFVTAGVPVVLVVADTPVPLQDLQVGATWVGDPATGVVNGLMRGFLTEADAEVTLLGDVPIVGGEPIASVLPGGTGCCAGHDDRDTLPDGTSGWWFYFNAVAEEVPWLGPQ